MHRLLLGILLFCLLASPDASLTTSIIWERNNPLYLWLFRFGGLSISDWILVTITLATITSWVNKQGTNPHLGPFVNIGALLIGYLSLGALYNATTYWLPKPWLYDLKVALWLLVPCLFYCASPKLQNTLSTTKIVCCYAFAGLLDWTVTDFGHNAEYPDILGVGIFPTVFGIIASVGVITSTSRRSKITWAAVLVYEVFSSISRLSIGVALSIFDAIAISVIIKRFKTKSAPLLFSWYVLTSSLSALAIYKPDLIFDIKTDGANTRQIQMDNILSQFWTPPTGIIGKGLGITWFELSPIPENDIYSVGTSVGDDSDTAMSSPVKSVLNWNVSYVTHRWGLLGVILIFLCIHHWIKGNSSLLRNPDDHFVLSLSVVLLIHNLTYVGLQRNCLFTSIICAVVIAASAKNRPHESKPDFNRNHQLQ